MQQVPRVRFTSKRTDTLTAGKYCHQTWLSDVFIIRLLRTIISDCVNSKSLESPCWLPWLWEHLRMFQMKLQIRLKMWSCQWGYASLPHAQMLMSSWPRLECVLRPLISMSFPTVSLPHILSSVLYWEKHSSKNCLVCYPANHPINMD